MKFCWCTITVHNMEESLKFYQEIVGLAISSRFMIGPTSEIAFLGEGETKIELIYLDENKTVSIGNDISLGFEVESVDEKIKFVEEKGFKVEGGPFQPNPNMKYFYVIDPNGVKIQFVENI